MWKRINEFKSQMPSQELRSVHPKTRKAWRSWLEKNHSTSPGVWLVFAKAAANKNRLPYAHPVEQALLFGWTDAVIRPIDAHTYMQWYAPRKSRSVWSKLNKTRVEKLTAA